MPVFIECHIFSQQNPPLGYDIQEFGPWEPINILIVHKIPGRHRTVDNRCSLVQHSFCKSKTLKTYSKYT